MAFRRHRHSWVIPTNPAEACLGVSPPNPCAYVWRYRTPLFPQLSRSALENTECFSYLPIGIVLGIFPVPDQSPSNRVVGHLR
jgi:hypothetical protein